MILRWEIASSFGLHGKFISSFFHVNTDLSSIIIDNFDAFQHSKYGLYSNLSMKKVHNITYIIEMRFVE